MKCLKKLYVMEPNFNGPTPVWVYSNACHHFTVPPPRQYAINNSYYQGIEDFFFYYENYAAYRYGFNKYVWLQMLPEFLGGFVKEVVLEQGLGINVDYESVKAKVVLLAKQQVDTERWKLNFLNFPRDASEPISVFVDRLEGQVASYPGMSGDMRRGLVRERLLRLLPSGVTEYLQANSISFEEVSSLELAELVQLYETSVKEKTERAEPPPPQSPIEGVSFNNSKGLITYSTKNISPTCQVDKSVQAKGCREPGGADFGGNKSTGRKVLNQSCGHATSNELTPPRTFSRSHRSWRRPRCWVCRSRWHFRVNCPSQHRRRLASRSVATGANATPIRAVVDVCSAPTQPKRSNSVGEDSLRNMFWDMASESNLTLPAPSDSRLSAGGEYLAAPETSTPRRGVTVNRKYSESKVFDVQKFGSSFSSAGNDDPEVMPAESRAFDWSYISDGGFIFPEFKDYLQISPLVGIC